MDYSDVMRFLLAEKSRLESAIAHLESLSTQPVADQNRPRRRGRKSMGAAERQEVAERMRRYWARRRSAGNGQTAQAAD